MTASRFSPSVDARTRRGRLPHADDDGMKRLSHGFEEGRRRVLRRHALSSYSTSHTTLCQRGNRLRRRGRPLCGSRQRSQDIECALLGAVL